MTKRYAHLSDAGLKKAASGVADMLDEAACLRCRRHAGRSSLKIFPLPLTGTGGDLFREPFFALLDAKSCFLYRSAIVLCPDAGWKPA